MIYVSLFSLRPAPSNGVSALLLLNADARRLFADINGIKDGSLS